MLKMMNKVLESATVYRVLVTIANIAIRLGGVGLLIVYGLENDLRMLIVAVLAVAVFIADDIK